MIRRRADNTELGNLLESQDDLVWAGFALLVNAPCGLHLDWRDEKSALVAITPWGEYHKGGLVLPQFDLRRIYKPGHLVLMKSSIIQQGVTLCKGWLYGFAGFVHHTWFDSVARGG